MQPVELYIKCGLRGRIREPVGTHGMSVMFETFNINCTIDHLAASSFREETGFILPSHERTYVFHDSHHDKLFSYWGIFMIHYSILEWRQVEFSPTSMIFVFLDE